MIVIVGRKAPHSIFFIFHIYIINMNQFRDIQPERRYFTMYEIGEIVVTPVPAGDTVICG